MFTFKERLKRLGMRILQLLWTFAKDVLSFAGNITAIVLTVVVVFSIARVVFPVDIVGHGEEQDEQTQTETMLELDYTLVGKEIAGTINAYLPIDGALRDGEEADPYSKLVANPKRYWDIHDEAAVGNPGYVRYGFLGFNQILDLSTGDTLAFPNVNFGEVSPEYISMQIAKTSETGGTIAIYLDHIDEKSLLAIFDVTEEKVGNGKTDFSQVIEKIGRGKEITGIHKIYVQVEQEGVSIGEIRFGR